MDAMVEKKLAKLKLVAAQHCKESVKEELERIVPSRFRDVYFLTDWFLKIPGVREDTRFRDSLIKYEAELKLWIEAYKYLKPNESPDYIPIIDTLLEVYDKVEFYSKDPNKEIDVHKSISIRLMISLMKDNEMKALVKNVQAKMKEVQAKQEEQQKQTATSVPTVSVPRTEARQPVQPVVAQPQPSRQEVRAPDAPKPKPPARKEPDQPATTQPVQPPPTQPKPRTQPATVAPPSTAMQI